MSKYTLSDKTFLIGSGKGGVGKSTVTVNLAVALAAQGLSVGVLDADVYGPSIPVMMGLRRLSPRIEGRGNEEQRVVPFSKFGIKVLSLGFFMEEARAVLWRGPMLHHTLEKMFRDVEWGDLDILLVDLPPGTGDVPMTLTKLTDINGAVVVITPQEVAMLDAIKCVNAFDTLQIPVLGVLENMAGFTTPDGQTHQIFGEGKGAELATRFDVPFLGSIPFIPDLRVGGDEGVPAAHHRSKLSGQVFETLASITRELDAQRTAHSTS